MRTTVRFLLPTTLLIAAPAVFGSIGGGGCAGECSQDSDCEGNSSCSVAVCELGECKIYYSSQGTTIPDDLVGDCMSITCDPDGNAVAVPDDTDPPEDIGGDCNKPACDGNGNAILVADDGDTPIDDGFGCTVESCFNGEPVFTDLSPGDSCGSGGKVCHADGRCDSCPDPDASCTDTGPGEPNDTSATAYSFGNITDDDSDGGTVCGVLKGAGDVDWYTYFGTDVAFSVVDPGRALDRGSGVRLCAYFACQNGNNDLTCPGFTTTDTGPGGAPGCCSDQGFSVSLDCDLTADDNAQVYIRVDNPNGLACAAYQFSYHY